MSYVEVRRLVLWLTDVAVYAFLGDLAGDTWNLDLNDRLGLLVGQVPTIFSHLVVRGPASRNRSTPICSERSIL